jgi:hypothetical protein
MVTLVFEVLPKEGGILGSVLPKTDEEVPSELLSNIEAMIARSDPTAEITVKGTCVAFNSGLPFETAHKMAQQIKAGVWRDIDGVRFHVKYMKPQRVVVAANFECDVDGLIEHLNGRVVL